MMAEATETEKKAWPSAATKVLPVMTEKSGVNRYSMAAAALPVASE